MCCSYGLVREMNAQALIQTNGHSGEQAHRHSKHTKLFTERNMNGMKYEDMVTLQPPNSAGHRSW